MEQGAFESSLKVGGQDLSYLERTKGVEEKVQEHKLEAEYAGWEGWGRGS